MAVTVPSVAQNSPLSVAWSDTVESAVEEVSDLAIVAGPVAMTLGTGWINYPGHAECQVARFGPIVVACGLLRNNTGAAVGPTVTGVATIPAGFRPRVAGASSPLGGTIMKTCVLSSSAPSSGRLDIGSTGNINIGYTTGSTVTIPNLGHVSIEATWIAEPWPQDLVLPQAAVGADLTTQWHNGIASAVNPIRDMLDLVNGPAAVPLATNWQNYGSNGAECQVYRFGPIVVLEALLKRITSTATPGGTMVMATVPSGYRPRPTGASAPLGGKLLTAQRCLASSGESISRVDIEEDGDIILQTINGTTSNTMAVNQWIALSAAWIGE